ncbi:alpha/beta hydrolase-fold protein [Streptomyces sp. NPDC051211]|uniref:alpha/beta hydrolase-fold protein n=1 Tax=Streptomyces sp. NPDC051211 TaxID=3154643 RepID=UPI00344B6685
MHQYPQRPRPDDQPYPGYQQPQQHQEYPGQQGYPGQGYPGQQGYEQPYGQSYGRQYQEQPHRTPQYQEPPYQEPPYGQPPYQEQPEPPAARPRRSRKKVWIGSALVVALLAGGGAGWAYWKTDWFDGNGETVSYGTPPAGQGAGGKDSGGTAPSPGGDPDVSLPTGPAAKFKQTAKLDDGTRISKTRLKGAKSGFEGDVWVWTPKEYDDPKYAKSGFPVLIALPGGNGYPNNYWADRSLGLQKAISEGAKAGTSLPFVLVMPVLNPDAKYYYDGSDIPGQAKMGTWMAEDIPAFAKANFRTYKSRDGWAFMGNSSGAFVGLKQVMQHPDRFKAVIANGGEIVPDSPLWKGHQKEMDANNPEKLAQKLIDGNGPEVYVNFQYGTKEGGRARLEKFRTQFGKGPVKVTIHEIKGGDHNGWDYVRGMKESALQETSKVMKAPKPDAG